MNFNLLPAIKAFFKTLFAKLVPEGEAAVKLAENDAKIAEATAKLATFSRVNRLKIAVVDNLHKAAAVEHTVADQLKDDLDDLIAKL